MQANNSPVKAALAAAFALAAIAAPAQARVSDAAPDLALNAPPVAAKALVGDRLTYQLTATNGGGGVATGVLLRGTLDGPAAFVSASTSRGECSIIEKTVECALGSVAPGADADATVIVETGGPGTVDARFDVAASEPDARPANNSVSTQTSVSLPPQSVQLPAAGPLLWSQVTARTAPRSDAKAVRVFDQLRRDLMPQIVFAVGSTSDAEGRLWYRVELPMRPNGRLGWIRADGVSLTSVRRTIVIDRSARRLSVFDGARVLLRTRVAVGRPGMETPLGNFYITAKFKPQEPILGAYAIETSAYSRLSEWPGGGIVGIHGTPMPWLLGQAVSHGCVRVANSAIERVARLAPLGTPVRIVA
jgi:uncharacterized repeat protein (TIGR01451 family)